MKPEPIDQEARRRFAEEVEANFAVSANAGSGKTTAISHRLASLALRPDAPQQLARTAVVTYTKKAAREIGLRARSVLLSRLAEAGRRDLSPLDNLERAFFGTIHSFCVQLARRYGHRLGVHLNPEVLDEERDEAVWMDFLSSDPMTFRSVTAAQWALFVRLQPLDALFPLARRLERERSARLRARMPGNPPTDLPEGVLAEFTKAVPKQARSLEKWKANVAQVLAWREELVSGSAYLDFPKPEGTANSVEDWYQELFAPLKRWVADVGGVVAAELSDRFRAYRLEKGLQTYADQVDLALRALTEPEVLDRIRADGWRVILDEAQDTDPQQFSVLVEITRPAGALPGTWPTGGGEPPRAGHFSLVGDGQQSIYSSRADLRNFMRHVNAFAERNGGERLSFSVSFRAPTALIHFLNTGLPGAFGSDRPHNLAPLQPSGAEPALMQVPYQPLSARPEPEEGLVARIPLEMPLETPSGVGGWMAEECRQIAALLARGGPASVGAARWGDVCLLAPRNEWLKAAKEALLTAGLKVAFQQRRSRSAENPVFAWWCGLLAVTLDSAHTFEWFGVLRELFAVPDDVIAGEVKRLGALRWDEPSDHTAEVAEPLERLRPFLLRAEDEGLRLGEWARELAAAVQMRELARLLDPSGGLELELERLLADATQLGLDGGGPREWFDALLRSAEDGRPVGRPEADAINLLTVHSAKGLEWSVVIPLGLWRGIGRMRENGLQCIEDSANHVQLYLSASEIPEALAQARLHEHFRELVRLQYVALTRPRQRLYLPWCTGFGKKASSDERSFAQLWGNTDAWMALPVMEKMEMARGGAPSAEEVEEVEEAEEGEEREEREEREEGEAAGVTGASVLPRRLLPHQLAQHPDPARRALDESPREPVRWESAADDAAAYGIWWHETVEFWPWSGGRAADEAHVEASLARADAAGWGERARTELTLFRNSEAKQLLEQPRWLRQAELPVLAPVAPQAWIDGIIDLLLRDAASGDAWLVDWKTNQRRRDEPDDLFCARLVAEYRPQLSAYRDALSQILPAQTFRLWLYPTALGRLIELT
ncbi:UvrD-helicase domain-containing protein [Nibricoccus sp. IMCC34717]|uniref:UvrD-helicase domain-containing protein n=1 Tax=Nibricoccus sp. IMCC34717 TaxID=3034021 RepID=UPI00384C1094